MGRLQDVTVARTPIRKLLVANRGEIARRVMRTARAMGIATVAVFSEPDAREPFVVEADEAVPIGGDSPATSYLNLQAIMEAARLSNADALHPGYGFLSEQPSLARACEEAGIVFVGPPAEVMEMVGSKLTAKGIAREAGVPTLDFWALPAAGGEGGGGVDPRAAATAAGYPVLVKASAGGGGRGMRVVREAVDLEAAVESAMREAASAFGDPTVFIEHYVERPRHVEVQIFGDRYGKVSHLFERECSIQRRYQKIIEECPVESLDEHVRQGMYGAAEAIGRAIGYVGAGTVEFLVDGAGNFWFMEVNARLQVEHAVTEAVTGVDLVRVQIMLAEGEKLESALGPCEVRGHAIEARLYAEDPSRDYLPSAGRISRFRIPDLPGLRVDASVETGSEVGVLYDPMLAKVIASAPRREEAAGVLAAALSSARIHGVMTNRALLVAILHDAEFLAGAIDTGFLDRHPPAELARSGGLPSEHARLVHGAVAALGLQALRREQAGVLAGLPSGWRNNESGYQWVRLSDERGALLVRYRMGDGRSGSRRAKPIAITVEQLSLDESSLPEGLSGSSPSSLDVALWDVQPGCVDIEEGGIRRRYEIDHPSHASAPAAVFVDGPDGSSVFQVGERFPLAAGSSGAPSLVAPMPGTVTKVGVAPGQAVEMGETLVVLEAMKMEHELKAPSAGVVDRMDVVVGEVVALGQVLAVMKQGDGETIL